MATQNETVYVGGYPPARIAKRVASIAFVLLAWWAVTVVGFPVLPTPPEVAAKFVDLAGSAHYWDAVVVSVARVYVAFLVAVALAVPLGLLMGWSDWFADLTFPSFEMIRPIPPIAFLPVAILLMPIVQVSLGFRVLEAKVSVLFITFLGAFFPVLLNTIDGMHDVDHEFSRAAESLGADRKQTAWHVYLPASLPYIHTGMVVGMGLAWVNLVAAEMLAGTGIGYLTWSSYTGGTYSTIIVGMISIGVLGYASSVLLRVLGNYLLGWQEASG